MGLTAHCTKRFSDCNSVLLVVSKSKGLVAIMWSQNENLHSSWQTSRKRVPSSELLKSSLIISLCFMPYINQMCTRFDTLANICLYLDTYCELVNHPFIYSPPMNVIKSTYTLSFTLHFFKMNKTSRIF